MEQHLDNDLPGQARGQNFFWWKGQDLPFFGVVIGWTLAILILTFVILLCNIIISIIIIIIIVVRYKYDPNNRSDSLFYTQLVIAISSRHRLHS